MKKAEEGRQKEKGGEDQRKVKTRREKICHEIVIAIPAEDKYNATRRKGRR